MKIFIRTLFPKIVVLIHIRELNSGDPGEGSQPQLFNTMNGIQRQEAQQQPNSLQPETSRSNQQHTLKRVEPQLLQEPHSLQLLQPETQQLWKRPRTQQEPPKRHEPYQRHTLQLLEPQLQPEQHQGQLQQDLQQLQLLHPHSDIHILKTPVIIDCLRQRIKAFVAIVDEEITTVACELIAEPPFNPSIPDINYKKKNNYVTRECRKNTIACVAYVDERGKVFGTKLPPNPNHYLRAGDPARLNPNPFTSFITCKNQEYEVTEDPHTKMVQRIRLLPKNRHPSENNGNNDIIRTGDFLCCGVRFTVYRTKNSHIVGAEVDKKREPQFILNNNPMAII